jgi:predicted XRE-type DNA-binding protein
MKNKHIGSNFDDFLKNEKILAETEALAIKRVIAYQIEKEMKKKKMTKVELAKKMKTSRSSLERLLDPENVSVTLSTLEKAAVIFGKKLKIKFA